MDKQFTIYFMDGMVAAFRNAILAETHSHHAVQLTLDFDGEFEVFHNEHTDRFKCAIIPQGLSHRLDACGHWQLTILLDPELTLTKKLVQYMELGDEPKAMPDAFVQSLLSVLPSDKHKAPSLKDFKTPFLNVLRTFVDETVIPIVDDRILQLIHNIHQLDDLSSIDHIIKQVPLSKSRLSHLFVEQIGIPLRSYLVWLKVRRSIDLMLAKHSITKSAHLAGFSDLAHLSRNFKKMFGMNVSLLFQSKDFIEIETEA